MYLGVGISGSINMSQNRDIWKFRLTYVYLGVSIGACLNISLNAHTWLTENCIRMHVVLSYRINVLNSVQCIVPIAFYLCINLKYIYSHFARNHP